MTDRGSDAKTIISNSAENVRDSRTKTSVIETGKALLARLDDMFPLGEEAARPTIADLERILANGSQGAVEIKPDGSIHVAPRDEIEAFRAALPHPKPIAKQHDR